MSVIESLAVSTEAASPLLTKPQHIINLSTAGVLVDVRVKVTTFSKSDRKIGDKASAEAGAKVKAVRASRDLFVDDAVLKALLNYRQTVAAWVKTLCYPWCGSQDYLPTALIPRFLKEVQDHEAEFELRKKAWGDRYDAAINDMAYSLGALFNRHEYPARDAMLSRFRFEYTITEIPQGDYRCAIANDLADDLAAHYNRQAMSVISEMQRKQHAELLKTVQSIAHCCGYDVKKDADGNVSTKRRKLYDDTLNRALELCSVFETFNLANDPVLEQARSMLNAAFSGIDIKQLKKSDTLRQTMQEQMNDILKVFSPASAQSDVDESEVDLSAFGV